MNKCKFYMMNSFRLQSFVNHHRTYEYHVGKGYTKVHDRCPKWVQYVEQPALMYY
jgi:hypothetical protein